MKVIAGGMTNRGAIRLKNQDRITFHIKNFKKRVIAIGCICDGIGSFENSEIASEIVIQKIDEWFPWVTRQYENGMSEEDIVEELANTIHEANETIFLLSKEREFQIGCTASVLLIINDRYYVFHVGDSRICGFRDGVMTQITRDEVSVREINGQVKTRLVNFMGRTMELWLSRINGEVREEDYFVLGSDGLFHQMMPEDFQTLMTKVKNDTQVQHICEKALQIVLSRGERDNISCVILQAKK